MALPKALVDANDGKKKKKGGGQWQLVKDEARGDVGPWSGQVMGAME